MSRVARSARVASRQRTELITEGKTLGAAETGELYFCSGSSAITVTLPPVQEGAYFKFIYGGGSGAGPMISNLIISCDGSGALLLGNVIQLGAAANVDAAVNIKSSNGSSNDKITITGPANTGDHIEVNCDGTNWHANGIISGSVAFGN